MELNNQTMVLGGTLFGLLVAAAGGWIDYRVRLRKPDLAPRVPALLMPVGALLGFLGLIAVALSLVFTGGIKPAVVIGIGVGIGFNIGFGVLFVLYLSRR